MKKAAKVEADLKEEMRKMNTQQEEVAQQAIFQTNLVLQSLVLSSKEKENLIRNVQTNFTNE
jgi:hypothetical protein